MNGNMDPLQMMGNHHSHCPKTSKYHNESVSASGRPVSFNTSMVPMGDHFPIELGFCITIPKAQGRNIHQLIASLSEHPCPFLRSHYEKIYTLLSHIM